MKFQIGSGLAVLLVSFGLPSAALAVPLTIQQAVKIALDRNPTVQYYRERLTEDEANYRLAIAQFFPNLSGIGSAYKEKAAVNGTSVPFGGTSYNQYTLQLKLDQPLYRGGALSSALAYASKDTEIRKRDLEIAERDLTTQVISAFYNVMTNRQLLNVLLTIRDDEKQTLAIAERFQRIGRAQLLDLLQIKTQVALINPQVSTAENSMKAAASQLMSLLHDTNSESVTLSGDLTYLDSKVIALALGKKTQMPELARSQVQIDQLKDKIDVTLAAFSPSLDFQGLYGKTANTQPDLINEFSNTWSVGFQLTVPIFAGLASVHQKQALSSQERQLVDQQQSLLDQLSYSQVQTERNLDTATDVLKTSKVAADYGVASLKEAQKQFKIGLVSYTQLNTSQQNYLDAQTRFINAKNAYIATLASYFVSAGIPVSELIRLLDAAR